MTAAPSAPPAAPLAPTWGEFPPGRGIGNIGPCHSAVAVSPLESGRGLRTVLDSTLAPGAGRFPLLLAPLPPRSSSVGTADHPSGRSSLGPMVGREGAADTDRGTGEVERPDDVVGLRHGVDLDGRRRDRVRPVGCGSDRVRRPRRLSRRSAPPGRLGRADPRRPAAHVRRGVTVRPGSARVGLRHDRPGSTDRRNRGLRVGSLHHRDRSTLAPRTGHVRRPRRLDRHAPGLIFGGAS